MRDQDRQVPARCETRTGRSPPDARLGPAGPRPTSCQRHLKEGAHRRRVALASRRTCGGRSRDHSESRSPTEPSDGWITGYRPLPQRALALQREDTRTDRTKAQILREIHERFLGGDTSQPAMMIPDHSWSSETAPNGKSCCSGDTVGIDEPFRAHDREPRRRGVGRRRTAIAHHPRAAGSEHARDPVPSPTSRKGIRHDTEQPPTRPPTICHSLSATIWDGNGSHMNPVARKAKQRPSSSSVLPGNASPFYGCGSRATPITACT
jgi:hypothetical protein